MGLRPRLKGNTMELQSLDLFNFVNQYADMPSDLAKVKTVIVTAHADGVAEIKVILNKVEEEIAEVVEDVKEFFGYGNPVPAADMPVETITPATVEPTPAKVVTPTAVEPALLETPVSTPVEVQATTPSK